MTRGIWNRLRPTVAYLFISAVLKANAHFTLMGPRTHVAVESKRKLGMWLSHVWQCYKPGCSLAGWGPDSVQVGLFCESWGRHGGCRSAFLWWAANASSLSLECQLCEPSGRAEAQRGSFRQLSESSPWLQWGPLAPDLARIWATQGRVSWLVCFYLGCQWLASAVWNDRHSRL